MPNQTLDSVETAMTGPITKVLALITSVVVATGDSASHALVAANNEAVPGPPPPPVEPITVIDALCRSLITQSTSQEITSGAPSCYISHPPPGGNVTTDTSHWRAFDMAAFSGRNKYFVRSISFGVSSASNSQWVRVRLYTNNGGTFPGGTRTEIASTVVGLAAVQSGSVVTAPLLAIVPARTQQLVMEVFSPSSTSALILGGNTAPETGASYWSSACTGSTPMTMTTHVVFNIYGSCAAQSRPDR